MKNEYLVYGAAAFLMILWTVLVFTNHNDPELIAEIRYLLVAVGVAHAGANLQRVQTPKGGGSDAPSNPPAKDAP